MSELKVILATPHPKMKNACDGAIEVYSKSEADKVIAELELKVARAQLILRLNKPEALYSNLETMSRLNHKIDVVERRERHQKYKRCLGKAEWCRRNRLHASVCGPVEKIDFWEKWRKRWLELAEQFNPTSTTPKENDNG